MVGGPVRMLDPGANRGGALRKSQCLECRFQEVVSRYVPTPGKAGLRRRLAQGNLRRTHRSRARVLKCGGVVGEEDSALPWRWGFRPFHIGLAAICMLVALGPLLDYMLIL